MSERWQSREDRILCLLTDQAAFGLSSDEHDELGELLAMEPEFDLDCMQRLAVTVHLACVGKELKALPASIHERILASASLSQGPSPDTGRAGD